MLPPALHELETRVEYDSSFCGLLLFFTTMRYAIFYQRKSNFPFVTQCLVVDTDYVAFLSLAAVFLGGNKSGCYQLSADRRGVQDGL